MYGKLQILARLSEDFDELSRIFSADPPDSFFFDQNFLSGSGLSMVRNVATGAVDAPLAIGDLTSLRMIVVFSDGPVTIKTAGGGTALSVGTASPSTLPGVFVLVGAGATTLLVSNSSGVTRRLRYFVSGA